MAEAFRQYSVWCVVLTQIGGFLNLAEVGSGRQSIGARIPLSTPCFCVFLLTEHDKTSTVGQLLVVEFDLLQAINPPRSTTRPPLKSILATGYFGGKICGGWKRK